MLNDKLKDAIIDVLDDITTLLASQPVDAENNREVDGESAHQLDMILNSTTCRSPEHGEVWVAADCELFLRCRDGANPIHSEAAWFSLLHCRVESPGRELYFKAKNLEAYHAIPRKHSAVYGGSQACSDQADSSGPG